MGVYGMDSFLIRHGWIIMASFIIVVAVSIWSPMGDFITNSVIDMFNSIGGVMPVSIFEGGGFQVPSF